MTAYRAYDLNGNLLDNNVKYDLEYMNKILKGMIYIDEMDTILLKVKGQGINILSQEKYLSICHRLEKELR